MTCIALTGGKSLRFGRDKVWETVGNRSLLQRVVDCLSLFERNIIIVRAAKQSLPQFTDYPRLRVVSDTYPEKGPLGGIYTGLSVSDSFHNLIVAGDMPFLNKALLGYMVELSDNFDIVLPRLGNMIEPLHGVYSKDCLMKIEDMLKQGTLGVRQLLKAVRVRYVVAEEIDRFDPKHLSFFNINTAADLRLAKRLAREEENRDKC